MKWGVGRNEVPSSCHENQVFTLFFKTIFMSHFLNMQCMSLLWQMGQIKYFWKQGERPVGSSEAASWIYTMAPHSSTLAWKIPWTEEPGRLQSMGSLRVGYDWATSLSLFTFMHRSRKWQPTPVFLPGESQGRGSLVGCRLWGRTESDMTEPT